MIAQATRLTFLSDDTEQPFKLNPTITAPSSKFIAQGTTSVTSSGTLSAVTQRNRATGQRLSANLGQPVASFVGLLLKDVTRNSYAWIDSDSSGNVAILTQPYLADTDCGHTGVLAYQDNVTNGDSYQVLRPPKVPIRSFNPFLSNVLSSGTGPAPSCLETLWIPDQSGTPGTAVVDLNTSGGANMIRVDPNVSYRSDRMPVEPVYDYNNYFNGPIQNLQGGLISVGIIGGSVYASESYAGALSSNGIFILDGGVFVHQFLLLSGGSVADVYDKNFILTGIQNVELLNNVGPGVLWGPGELQVGPSTTLLLGGGLTATGSLQQTGGLFFGNFTNVTTACAFDTSVDPAVWHCGRTLTPAHIDGTIVGGGFGGSALDPALKSGITNER